MVNDMATQRHLFSEEEILDARTRMKKCLRCRRRLHADVQERFSTRNFGLCYRCIREFEQSSHWNIDTFVNGETKAVVEFFEAADSFGELFNASE